ncbi:MAG: hypothetical protein ACYC3S_09770 [Chloroflexota bacterium]
MAPLASIANVAKFNEFWRVLRDLNPEAVRRDVERGFRLALLGRDESGKEALRRALRPIDGHGSEEYLIDVDELDGTGRTGAIPQADLYLYVVDACAGLQGADVSALEQLYLLARPTALVYAGENCSALAGELAHISRDLGGLVGMALAIDPHESVETEARIASLLANTLPNRSLAMGRVLRSLRPATADSVIDQTARVNAEFALLSNLPANVPVLGTLLGAGADFLVLTKNQAMMVLKLAAIYGHSLDSKWQLAAEMVPVVGAGFTWRTVARLMVGTLPSFVAAVPKAAIAYAGTYVVGKAARYYFEHGERPRPEAERRYAEEAAAQWQEELAGSAR